MIMEAFEKQRSLFKQDIHHHRSASQEKQHWEIGLASEDAIYKLQAAFNKPEDARKAIALLLEEKPEKFSRGQDYDQSSRLVYARLQS